jgi:hypothetical protein
MVVGEVEGTPSDGMRRTQITTSNFSLLFFYVLQSNVAFYKQFLLLPFLSFVVSSLLIELYSSLLLSAIFFLLSYTISIFLNHNEGFNFKKE